MTAGNEPLNYAVLGPLTAWRGTREVELGTARPRAVLAVLLLEMNRLVPITRLIDAVWGDQLPGNARATVHTNISRLRNALRPPNGPGPLTSSEAGYVLRGDPDALDLTRFDRHLTSAHEHHQRQHNEAALGEVDAALALWRGEPFGGLDGPRLEAERQRLRERRLAALELRAAIQLDLGQHAALIPDLAGLIGEHPHRERLRASHMLALYRCGRRAEALQAFQDTREASAEHLGTEPSDELQRLHQKILLGDAGLEGPAAPPRARPNRLPRDMADFTGRDRELDRLHATLPAVTGSTTAIVINAIDGMAGIGKTALAVRVAHQLTERYPDAQLFIDLHAHTEGREPTEPAAALDILLRALGVPGERIPHDLDERAALWRAELADRKALVVLDNAAGAAQVRPLLPGNPDCLVLITSRRRLTDLESAHNLALEVLPEEDALALFTRIVNDGRALTEPAAAREVVRLCGHLPLAIRIAAARLRSRPHWTVRLLADRLREGHRRLGELAAGSSSVTAAFDISYRDLSGERRRMFRLLGLHPGPDFDAHAAAALADTDPDDAEGLLEDLVDVHLLEQDVAGRYRFHDLLRDHAHRRAHDDEPPGSRWGALRRLVGFYLSAAFLGSQRLNPHRTPIGVGRSAGRHLPDLADVETALTWFDTELFNLLAGQGLARQLDWHAETWQLAWTLDNFHLRRGHLNNLVAMWHSGLAAAQKTGNRTARNLAHRMLGDAYLRQGRLVDAFEHLHKALALAERTRNAGDQADVHRTLAEAWEERGEHRRALAHVTHAVTMYQEVDAPIRLARALNQVGWYHAHLGHTREATTRCEQAGALFRRYNNAAGWAMTLDSLGYAAFRAGEHRQALDHYRRALALRRQIGNTYGEADTLARLGDVHRCLGEPGRARAAWGGAGALYRDQGRTADAERIHHQLAELDSVE